MVKTYAKEEHGKNMIDDLTGILPEVCTIVFIYGIIQKIQSAYGQKQQYILHINTLEKYHKRQAEKSHKKNRNNGIGMDPNYRNLHNKDTEISDKDPPCPNEGKEDREVYIIVRFGFNQ